MVVDILKGKFAGLRGIITSLNEDEKTADVEIVDENGSKLTAVVLFSDIKSE